MIKQRVWTFICLILIGTSILYSFYKFIRRSKDIVSTFSSYYRLNNNERSQMILDSLGYRSTYRFIQEIQRFVPDTENIVCFNPENKMPERIADFLWKASYYLCPRYILQPPESLIYKREWCEMNNVKWVLYINNSKINFSCLEKFISSRIFPQNKNQRK